MSKYNSYAQKLDELFRDARANYMELVGKLQDATREERTAHAWRQETYIGEREARQAVADAKLKEENARFRSEGRRIWEDFDRKVRELRKEFVSVVKAGAVATPEDVDMQALKLLESGVLTSEDMLALSDRFDGSPTMLRIIGKYAKESAETARAAGNNMEALQFSAVYANSKNGESKMVKQWDDLASIARYCSGVSNGSDRRTSDPEYTTKMCLEWERVSENAIKNF